MILNTLISVMLILLGGAFTGIMAAEISAGNYLESVHRNGKYGTIKHWVLIVIAWLSIGVAVWRVWG